MFCVLIYNECNKEDFENYELKYTSDAGITWKQDSIHYCNNKSVSIYLLKDIDRLISFGYKFIGIRNGDENIW